MPRDESFRRGLSLELFVAEVGESERAAYAEWLDEAARKGATDLELVVQWSQLDATTVELAPSATLTVDDDFLGLLLDRAHERHLRVMLTPVVELEQAPKDEQRALSPHDLGRWFWSYHRFLLHYARIAEAHRADGLAVGADLPDALARADAWDALIKDVRKAYKGKLTYVARAQQLETLPMWAELDYVALVGVGPFLSADAKSGLAKQGSQLLARLHKWSKAHAKPLVLSSVRSAASAAKTTDARGTTEQLVGMRSLYQTLQDDPSVAGVYMAVALPSAASAPEPALASASAAVLHHWYSRSRSSAPVAPLSER
jgi:hypothetical protein